MNTTPAEIEPHAFVNDDPAGPCMHMDGVGDECGRGSAHQLHVDTAATDDEHAELEPRYPAPVAQAEPQREPADRLIAALGPDGMPDPDDGDAAETLADLTVEDLDGAAWAARRLHRANGRIAALSRYAADQHARINDWLEKETAALARDVAFFEGRLLGFHEYALRADSKRAKTINLPDGTALASQAGKLAVEITDVAKLIAYAETEGIAEEILDYPDPKPKKVEIGKKFASKAEGELEPGEYPAFDRVTGGEVPGIAIVRKPRTFSVRPPAGEDK